MKKMILYSILMFLLASLAFAQAAQPTASGVGQPDPAKINADSAQQMLVEVSVTKTEDVAYWATSMMHDHGIVQFRRFEGSPAGKEPLPGESVAAIEESDRYVLGAKVQFFRRGDSSFSIYPVKPIPIEGITKTISVWVVGRNYNHTLKVVIEDYFGQQRELTMGKLNFMGWKKLTVAIPPSIIQDEYHYTNRRGLKFIGFRVDADMKEAYGAYYIYFDDIRAVSDLFDEYFRDQDDMSDAW